MPRRSDRVRSSWQIPSTINPLGNLLKPDFHFNRLLVAKVVRSNAAKDFSRGCSDGHTYT